MQDWRTTALCIIAVLRQKSNGSFNRKGDSKNVPFLIAIGSICLLYEQLAGFRKFYYLDLPSGTHSADVPVIGIYCRTRLA